MQYLAGCLSLLLHPFSNLRIFHVFKISPGIINRNTVKLFTERFGLQRGRKCETLHLCMTL